MRRKRSDAKLFNLDESQQARLVEMLVDERLPYHKVRELIAQPAPDGFGVRVSLDALSRFWDEACGPAILARQARAAGIARSVGAAAAKNGISDEGLVELIKERVLYLSTSGSTDPEAWAFVTGQFLTLRAQELKRSELELKREKFEFDAAKACLRKLPELKAVAADKGLGAEEKLARVRAALFGELPVEAGR